MRQTLRLLLGCSALALVVVIGRGSPTAEAHGTQDQFLTGDPGCLAAVFRATAPSSGALRQEFVPSNVGTGLQSVDTCLSLGTTANIVLNVRAGTVAAPGAILATASATSVPAGAARWVHFELATFLPLTTGTTYLLEISGFPLFSWRGTCGVVGGACTTIDADLYAPGVSSSSPTVGDFAFRTYASTDADGDGIADPIDNCINAANFDQANHDANFIDQTPPSTADDQTWINADVLGDACDPDNDNDGMIDTDETSLPGAACPGATSATDPNERDTDLDRYFDGAECTLGTDPANAASKPTAAQCATHLGGTTATDTDGDGVKDYLEFCNYASNPNNANTDGDICTDGKEVASVNIDNAVNAGDQLLLLNELLRVPPPAKLSNMDFNKDGGINAGDQLFQVLRFGMC